MPTAEEELTERMARVIWNNLSSLCGDYSVPFEDIMRRPRYEGLRTTLLRTAAEALEVPRPQLWEP